MREWNSDVYHKISDPQLKWGLKVLDRLPLDGDELVVDAGCGTGRLTAYLLERLPRGRVIAADLSRNMLTTAREFLAPRSGRRIQFVQADAAALPIAMRADAIFSNAAFHWVRDHKALFRSLYEALVPSGRLVAQCGGDRNVERVHRRCESIMAMPRFAPFFRGWREPWEFADAPTTAGRLKDAGFIAVRTHVEYAPLVQPDAAAFTEFVANVICRPHLACLPDESLRADFVAQLATLAAQDDPPFELDYWRLNLEAQRPSAQDHRPRRRSSSSSVCGQSSRSNRDSARSASSRPPV